MPESKSLCRFQAEKAAQSDEVAVDCPPTPGELESVPLLQPLSFSRSESVSIAIPPAEGIALWFG